jgi:predicted membrane-bound mannosyltransferase
MNDSRRFKYEYLFFLLAFGLALFLRVFQLGATPLNDLEANWALQALQLAQGSLPGGSIGFGPQPGYISITGLLFYLLGGSNGLARLWPALAGTLLVLAPWLFSRKVGGRPAFFNPKAAILMAFGLAIDPGLVSMSRQVGSPIMALSMLVLAAGCWYLGRDWLAGALAALALMAGPAILTGLLGLSLAWLVFRFALREPVLETAGSDPHT